MKIHHIVIELTVATPDVVQTQEVVNVLWERYSKITDILICENESWLVTTELIKERNMHHVN